MKELNADVNYNPNDRKLMDEIKAQCKSETKLKDFDGNHPPKFPGKETDKLKLLDNYGELDLGGGCLYYG